MVVKTVAAAAVKAVIAAALRRKIDSMIASSNYTEQW